MGQKLGVAQGADVSLIHECVYLMQCGWLLDVCGCYQCVAMRIYIVVFPTCHFSGRMLLLYHYLLIQRQASPLLELPHSMNLSDHQQP